MSATKVTPEWYDGHVTDENVPDKLLELMEELRSKNITTIDGQSCCGTCASHEAASVAKEEDSLGYATFNEQSIERTDEVYLSYGATGDLPASAIAGIIAETAEELDMEWHWTGTSTTCVKVEPRRVAPVP